MSFFANFKKDHRVKRLLEHAIHFFLTTNHTKSHEKTTPGCSKQPGVSSKAIGLILLLDLLRAVILQCSEEQIGLRQRVTVGVH